MAAVHARWWGHRALSGLSGAGFLDEIGVDAAWQHYGAVAAEMLGAAAVPARFLKLAERLIRHRVALAAEFLETAPLTCLHRDLHIDNVLFTVDGAAVLLDWQFCGKGRGAWDLGYFLISSLAPALRRHEERGLVADYHAELLRRGVRGYGLDTCWQDYLQSVAGKLWVTVAATVAWDNAGDFKRTWRRVDLERLVAFCDDHAISAASFG
jgi:thiamine kinase-like enzyme